MAGVKGRSGRPQKSVAKHKKDGTYQKCRHEKRAENSGKFNSAITKPEGLDEIAGSHWDEVIAQLSDTGVIKTIDSASIRAMCECWSLYRSLYPLHYADPMDKDVRLAMHAALEKWNYYMCRFGMTPADRAKLRPDSVPEVEVDPFAAFMERKGSLN